MRLRGVFGDEAKTMGICMAFVLWLHAYAHAALNSSESRGELLYATHCNACHSAEVHWRKLKLATDWDSLVAQVRR